jgi:hypothetical protein
MDEIDVRIKLKLECAECGEVLTIEPVGGLNYNENEFKVAPCFRCIESAQETAKEEGREEGREEGHKEGYDEGFKDAGGQV